ncbi:hypothetical protein PR048_024140 [Dryococelus australis]|uniref:DDE Tnp4 domain-containing protein n=1 Tax=Dryococelus australis TaxID=614101 RepID=A0ABQ9GW15_9NEOP|nr:hypothetical protein PR048_024140 [Dryococelus australis]
MPYVILRHETFKLTSSLMRPYPKEQCKNYEDTAIYNYRHRRARRTPSNAFANTLDAIKPDTVDHLVMAACIIHNLLRTSNITCPIEGDGQDVFLPTEHM